MEIVKYPHPLLREKTREIPKITKEILKLAPAMVKIMDEHEGIGLAGPQVGRKESIIIVKDGEKNLVFFNPKILRSSKQKGTEEEGCLSLPGLFLKVRRPVKVEVAAQDAVRQRHGADATAHARRMAPAEPPGHYRTPRLVHDDKAVKNFTMIILGRVIYERCADCGKIVRLNKWLVGSLHLFLTDT